MSSILKVIICFAIAICLFLTACGSSANPMDYTNELASAQPMKGFDAQNKYLLTRICSFQENDTVLWGSSFIGNSLRYYDISSGISGILCADPSCSHNSTDCSAYVQAGSSLSYYNGKLYWIALDTQSGSDYFLWRGDISGLEREKVKRIRYEDVLLPYQPQQYIIHRGKLFILGQASIVTGTQASSRVTLLVTELDDSDKYSVLYDESFSCGIQSAVRFIGENVYLSMISFPDGGPYDIAITKFDIESGDSELIYSESKVKAIPGDIWVTTQEEIYLPGCDSTHAYIWKLENGRRTEIYSSKNTSYSIPSVLDGIAVNIYNKKSARWVEVVKLTGEIVYDGELFHSGIQGLEGDPNKYTFAIIGADEGKIILNLQNFTETGMIDHMLMLDLHDSLKPTILWSTQ